MAFDPFADLTRLRQQIDRMMDEGGSTGKPREGGRVWRPLVDLFEDADALTLKLDLPGVDREKLDVQITGEELVIRGERTWTPPQQGSCVHSERPYGQFHRAFRLGVPVQSDRVEANYEDGVLVVRLPKAENVKPRKVEVRTESAG
jgi:HSP20 family protein